jgi:hypothetical protein
MGVKSFMDEFVEATQANPLDERERVFQNAAFFQIRPFESTVRLSNIRTVKPGRGAGREGLQWLLSLADKHQISIFGEAEPTGHCALDAGALRAWYHRHGFKVSSRGDIEYTPGDAQ